jgi:hypothetical protein
MALWSTIITHAAINTGGVVVGFWVLLRSSDPLLRLIAGLVAIFGHDKRSRAARAIDVLRAICQKDEPRQSVGRSRTAEMYSNPADRQQRPHSTKLGLQPATTRRIRTGDMRR